MNKPTLLLVDDSELTLSELSLVLRESDRFSRILKARDGEEAIRTCIKDRPGVIVLDLQMPRMDGFTFLRWVIANQPVPVIIFSSAGTDENIFRALDLGAVDFITKPETYIDQDFRDHFLNKIDAALQAQVQPDTGKRQAGTKKKQPSTTSPLHDSAVQALLIGASTGGPTAIQHLLESMSADVSFPVFIAQHMPRAFTSIFAQRLNMMLDWTVKEATDGEKPEARTVYICPGNLHMEIEHARIRLTKPGTTDRYIPSVDRLFASAATAYGERAVAVVLTGMGKDGAEGGRKISERGGLLIAEARETCVVYGMPKALIETGCPVEEIPLDRIAGRVSDMRASS